MAQPENSTIRSSLTTLLPPRRIRKLARQYGEVQRQRKVDIVALVFSLTLGLASGKRRTLTAFRRSYEKSTGTRLAPSAFYGRFNRALVRLVRDLVNETFSKLSEHSGKAKGRVFRKFAEVLAIDSTLIRLHDALELAYPSIRPPQMRASAKLGMVMNVASRGVKSIKITYGRRNDLKTLGVGSWVKNRLLVFDRGYFQGMLFTLIGKHGGFFLCRIRETLNPLILRSHLPEGRHFEGRMFKQARRCFISDVIDFEVEMHYEFRQYRKPRRSERYGRFRIVGIWNEDSERYHFFITNLPVSKMKAEHVAAVYAARWEVAVTSKGRTTQSVRVRPRLKRSRPRSTGGGVAREQDAEALRQHSRKGGCATPQVVTYSERGRSLVTRIPVAETVYNARRQHGPAETGLIRRSTPAGYQRRHGAKGCTETGETLGVRRRNPAEEARPITVSGKWKGWHQGVGSGHGTVDPRAAKRAGRDGPGPADIPFADARQG
jgi:putative transposase